MIELWLLWLEAELLVTALAFKTSFCQVRSINMDKYGLASKKYCIMIIVGRKWRRMNLAEFARHFHLTEMEKQAYILNKVRGIFLVKNG